MIYIDDIPSFSNPESFQINVNDRQEKFEVFGGHVVQDLGIEDSDFSFSVTVLFSKANFNKVVALWKNRTLVTFTDESGEIWQGCRVILKSYKYQNKFPDYVMATFEIWRC